MHITLDPQMPRDAPRAGASPAVSVIVPVHDVAAHIGPCLQSLREQTFTDFEVIVVDDGSTDGSDRAARTAIARDPRFRLIRQDNRGLSEARNAGLDGIHVERGSPVGEDRCVWGDHRVTSLQEL